jgi:hypothetical protein
MNNRYHTIGKTTNSRTEVNFADGHFAECPLYAGWYFAECPQNADWHLAECPINADLHLLGKHLTQLRFS